jgi:hypothetical protein
MLVELAIIHIALHDVDTVRNFCRCRIACDGSCVKALAASQPNDMRTGASASHM